MKIVEKKISDLTEYKNNPRNNDGAVQAVANSIKEFGFKVPVVVDKNDVIVCGHTRIKAARLLGMESVPCVVADDLTPEQIKAFRLADNKTAELASWDAGLLSVELEGIGGIDMQEFGFAPVDLRAGGDDGEIYTEDDIEDKVVYQEKYGVIVMCRSEEEQEKTYDDLRGRGYDCKVVCT